MTEDFHVHGPHDHELEHAAHNAHLDPFSGRIAVMTAILATVAALFSYQGGATSGQLDAPHDYGCDHQDRSGKSMGSLSDYE